MGRFISRDSYQGRLAEPVSLHRYLYANSNPISFRDPTDYSQFLSWLRLPVLRVNSNQLHLSAYFGV